uniref:Uncharacterized protein n=1 Tax=Tetradesmus obliquus TaxID=3088 RepID=A0A383VFZ1_TETOB
MSSGSSCDSPSMSDTHNGADVVSACGPLQLIAASSFASCKDSKQATQQLCNLLSTSRVFSQALQSCQGLVPVVFGPAATAEAAIAFARWLVKYGRLAGSLDMQLIPVDAIFEDQLPNISKENLESQHSASTLAFMANVVIAAALEKAAAAARSSSSSSSSPGGLHIRSCTYVPASCQVLAWTVLPSCKHCLAAA